MMKTLHLPLTIVVLLAIAMMRPAVAGNPLPGYYQDTGLNPFRSTANQNFDEHIDPFTGTLQLHHVDSVVPGNGGFDLTLQRSFNSPTATFGSGGDTSSYNRTPNVGVGWSLLIGGRLYGAGSACTQTGVQMILETPDGARQALLPTGLGDFLSAARWRAVCVQNGVQVYAPNGTRYDMLKPIAEAIPNTIQGASFLYPTLITDRNGNTATLSYINQGPTVLLNNVATSDGRSINFFYQAYGALYLLSSVANSQGSWTYSYQLAFSNISGQGVAYLLTRVSPPAGSAWSYDYNTCPTTSAGSCSVRQLTYPEGGSIYYNYNLVNFNDGTGYTSVVSSKTGPTGNWSFSYSPGGSYDVTTANTPLGVITYKHFGYHSVAPGTTWKIGLLAERNVGSAQTETYAWDRQQISPYPTDRGYVNFNDTQTYAPLLTQRSISRGGGTFTTSYSNFDGYGNPRSIYESGNRSHSITRDYCTNTSKWIINVPGTDYITGTGQISRSFDGNCNLTNETRFGVHTGFTYDGAGNMASRTDANSRTTNYSLHLRGIPQIENRPEGVTISRTIDQSGNILSQTDGANNTYGYNYDAIRRMSRLATPVGSSTNISWSGNGFRSATRGAYSETLSLDGLANPTSVTRSGISTSFSYDAFSNKTFESLPGSGSGTRFSPDILGRVTTMTNSDNSSRSFTYGGYSVSVRDERNNSTTYDYVAFGDPDKKFLVRISLPTGNTITINRDDLGNITSVSQGGITRSYGYDGSYFLSSITDPETGTTSFGRDAVGNMTSSSVGGRQTTYTYDGLNRLTHISYPNGNPVSISYYGNGRTQSITGNQATRTYNYDGNANLSSETLTTGGQSFTIGYSYNSNDALSTINYPITGDGVSYSPDSLGRPSSASPFVTSISHFPSGNVSSMSYANGVSMSYGENGRAWPSSLSASRGSAFLNKSYTYDGVGNVSQISDSINPTLSMSMGYDNINELTSASGPWGNATLGYDSVGNINSYILGSTQRTYSYSSNKLSTFGSRSFGYDGYGNVTSDGVHTFQYDDASNPTCLDCPAAGQTGYIYDGNNRRVSRTQNGVTTYYVHASNGDLLLEYTPSTNAKVEHIYVQGKRVATKTIPQ